MTSPETHGRADSARPLVSVVLPTYDRPDMLMRALGSLMVQTYRPLEIVVVDDGSKQDIRAAINEPLTSSLEPTVRYVRKENDGVASARNVGRREARGELIAFLDDDDEWLPTAAETLAACLQASGADFAYSPVIELETGSAEWVNLPVAAERPDDLAEEHFMLTNVRSGSTMFRRRVFETVGGYREDLRHNEDSDFVQRAAVACRACYSPQPTAKIHNHPGSKSRNRVAIQRALLASSTSVLKNNPAFEARLGSRASARLAQIRGQLCMELMGAGDFVQARQVAREGETEMGRIDRLCLLAGASWPKTMWSSVEGLGRQASLSPRAAARRARALLRTSR